MVSLGMLMVAAGTAAAGPLEQPAFSAKPAALLAAARAAPARDASVVVLRYDITVTFDASGRAVRTFHIFDVVERPAGIDDFGTIELSWRPFYQDRPAIRARVIAPDGTVATLDPSLIKDSPAVSDSPQVFSDRRNLQAPLPRLVVGAVIEKEYTIRDRAPLLAAGATDVQYVTGRRPIEHQRIVFSAPTSLHLHPVTRGFATAPRARRTTARGRTTWRYDLGALPADAPRDQGIPSDVYADAYIGVATGASWAAVADGYRQLVDARLAHGVALPAGVRGATARETIDRASAWLHAHVRYTGIELADSAIIPASPADTVKRGFGDCKDTATLLVSLLRAGGVDADVALLWTGPGVDVDPDLPGMGQFDHAIVRAHADGKDVWIDATEPDLPPGQLPSRDQGRRALIVAAGTSRLVSTPVAAPRDNLVHEVRTFHLAEAGWGSATEVTREHGVYWSNLRAWYRDTSRADVATGLTGYVKASYLGTLTGSSGAVPADVTRPFDLTVEVKDSHRAYTDRDHISVYLPAGDLFTNVPRLFKAEDAAAEVARRTVDYAWYTPHLYEIENRLELPPGYTAPTLVPHEEVHLGTLTLTRQRRIDGTTVVITYCLDTGKRRITADELRADRAAVVAFLDGNAEHVVIRQTGSMLLDQGKVKEALAEYQRLIALHPKEAVHYEQLAEAYRRAGMGAAARRAARKATEVEPTSGDAYAMLAYELRRDSLGREYGWDADRKDALTAYRKALERDPHHLGAMEDLASLLRVDEHGEPSTSARDLAEAVGVLRRARTDSGDHDYDQRLTEAQLAAGDFAGAEETSRDLDSVAGKGLRVAATAMARSPADAITLAGAIAGNGQRDPILWAAVGDLMKLGHYDQMRALEAASSTAGRDPRRAQMISNLGRLELSRLDPADPRIPGLDAVVAMTGDRVDHAPWGPEVAMDLADMAKIGEPTIARSGWRKIPRRTRQAAMVAGTPLTVDGSAAEGWRLTVAWNASTTQLYVALDHGRARLVGGAALPTATGHYALTLLARHDLAGAARWLGRYVDDARAAIPASMRANLPKIEVTTVYRAAVDAAGGRPPPREIVETVAAVLISTHDPAAALAHLHRCKLHDPTARITCQATWMAAASRLHRWDQMLAAATQLAADAPTPELAAQATAARASALFALGRRADAIRVVDEALTKTPDAGPLLFGRAALAIGNGIWKDAQPAIAAVVKQPDPSATELNDLAWTRLYYDPDPSAARPLADRAVKASDGHPSSGLLNTVAAIEAEADDPVAAWRDLRRALDERVDKKPTSADWYVVARIAQAYGLRDDAIAAYRRVTKPTVPVLLPSAYDFARRHLKELGAR